MLHESRYRKRMNFLRMFVRDFVYLLYVMDASVYVYVCFTLRMCVCVCVCVYMRVRERCTSRM